MTDGSDRAPTGGPDADSTPPDDPLKLIDRWSPPADMATPEKTLRAVRLRLQRQKRRRRLAVSSLAAAAVVLVSTLLVLRGPKSPPGAVTQKGPPSDSTEELAIIENLDVLQTLVEAEVELTPEFVAVFLEDVPATDGGSEVSDLDTQEIFEYFLEEEFAEGSL